MGVHLLSLIRFANVRHMLCFLAGERGLARKKKSRYLLSLTQKPNLSTLEDFFLNCYWINWWSQEMCSIGTNVKKKKPVFVKLKLEVTSRGKWIMWAKHLKAVLSEGSLHKAQMLLREISANQGNVPDKRVSIVYKRPTLKSLRILYFQNTLQWQ